MIRTVIMDMDLFSKAIWGNDTKIFFFASFGRMMYVHNSRIFQINDYGFGDKT